MNDTRPREPAAPTLARADQAGQLETLRGARVILANADGQYGDYRAWSELVIEDGNPFVDVVRERHWWIWQVTGVQPRLLRWPAGAAWVVEWTSERDPAV